MTGIKTVALASTLGLAAVSWVVAFRQMNGMEMGVGTELGSFAFFITMWVPMMAGMMLPGTFPAILKIANARGRLGAVFLFVGSYLLVWSFFGVGVYMFYRPHGPFAAGAVVIAAGVYELTPLKKFFRQQCCINIPSGFEFGLYCVGSSIGLMLMQLALGIMSMKWMLVIAVIVFGQKILPAKAAIDIPLALIIIGFGILIVISPSTVPGLMPSM